MDFRNLFTEFEGRIGRQQWWIGVVVLIVASIVASLIVNLILGQRLGTLLVNLAALYPAAALMAKRLHDHGMDNMPWLAVFLGPGVLVNLLNLLGITGSTIMIGDQPVFMANFLGWLLNLVVLVIGLWGLYLFGIKKGQDGANEHGPDPVAAA